MLLLDDKWKHPAHFMAILCENLSDLKRNLANVKHNLACLKQNLAYL